jgi:hypothetical protein
MVAITWNGRLIGKEVEAAFVLDNREGAKDVNSIMERYFRHKLERQEAGGGLLG